MNRRLFLLGLAGTASASAQETVPAPTPPTEFLAWSMEQHRQLLGVSVLIERVVIYGDLASSRLPEVRTLRYAAPNRFSLVGERAGKRLFWWVCDGKAFVFQDADGGRQSLPVPDSLASAVSKSPLLARAEFGGSALFPFFGGRNLASQLAQNRPVIFGDDITVDNEAYKTLLVSGAPSADECRIAIRPRDGLVRRIVHYTAERPKTTAERDEAARILALLRASPEWERLSHEQRQRAEAYAANPNRPMITEVETLKNLVVNPSLPPDVFALPKAPSVAP